MAPSAGWFQPIRKWEPYSIGKRSRACSFSTHMGQPNTAILLIMALVATLFAPVRAGWACPDGTPCVSDRGEGYYCTGDRRAIQTSCCRIERSLRCRHGAFPGNERPERSVAEIIGPDRCQFSVSTPPPVVAAAKETGKLLTLSLDSFPAPNSPEVTVPRATPAWQSAYALGYRPPPIPPTGPSRAPPTA